MQFAPSNGHWCVCKRPLGGAQRSPLLRFFKPFTHSYHRRILFTDFSSQPRFFDRLNDNNVVLRCSLHYSIGRYFVIHDYRFPTPRFTLRTDDGTFGCFDALFKDFHQYFDFPFIHDYLTKNRPGSGVETQESFLFHAGILYNQQISQQQGVTTIRCNGNS